jgi:hypothetical protein
VRNDEPMAIAKHMNIVVHPTYVYDDMTRGFATTT